MTPFQIFAVVQVATSFMGYLGSRQQMQNMAVAAKWDKYHDEIRRKYTVIQANERARKLLSAKRAAQGARGVQIGTGSTLMEQNAVVANLEDTIFWINKGAEMSVRDIDLKLAGLLQEEAWKAGTSLITGMGTAYSTYKEI